MNTIEDRYRKFEKRIVDGSIPDQQRKEMRLLFFAGAYELLLLQLEVSGEKYSEEASMMMIQGLHKECKVFFETYND